MNDWKPINDADFKELFEKKYSELTTAQQRAFDRRRVPFWKATVRRSEATGDERVNVVARVQNGVLYFDDVEYGFNISEIDSAGRVLAPGGSQNTLKEAIEQWFSSHR